MYGEAHTQAGEGVDTVNVHGAGTADTLTAGTTEGQGRVELVLDANESVQHHGTGLVQVKLVALHGGLLGRRVRVPAVDLEGLHIGVLRGSWIGDLGLNGRIGASEAGGPEERPRRSEEAGGGAEGGHGGRMERGENTSSARGGLYGSSRYQCTPSDRDVRGVERVKMET